MTVTGLHLAHIVLDKALRRYTILKMAYSHNGTLTV